MAKDRSSRLSGPKSTDDSDLSAPSDPEETRATLPRPGSDASGEEPTLEAALPRSAAETTVPLPQTISGYRILGQLGAGGMGVVFEAEQPHPRRRVALKVIRGGAFVDELQVRMFKREVDTLARLKHPNIGGIYDAGRTEEGRHYFAMELVEGETLGQYLSGRPATTEQREIEHRLRIFRQICDAVHYAHQRGVIHRDLKPSNIVVGKAEQGDSVPEVKILDFGLARITDQDAGATMLSEAGSIKGTLPYMSPEQARGETDQIDLRTDVYALGVVLYETLVGALPYDTKSGSLMSSLKVICEVEPKPLQTAWQGVRRVDPDLVTIVGKALEKEADDRYGSAAALSEDIERFLTSQPILARPPSTAYQLKKLVARNKLPTALASSALVLLVGFAVWMTLLYGRATRAEAAAIREAETATQVSDFLVELFEVSDPSEAQGNTITAREILDRGAERIGQELADQPVVEARLLHTVGKVYRGLGLLGPAKPLLEESLALREINLGAAAPEVATTLDELGSLQLFLGEWEEAEGRLLRARDIRTAAFGAESLEVAETLTHLGHLYREQTRWGDAEAAHRLAAAIQEKRLPVDDPALAEGLEGLGRLLAELDRTAEAEPLVNRSLAIREKHLGSDHPQTIASLTRLAQAYHDRGDFARAGSLLTELVVRRRRVLGPEHPETLEAIQTLADVNSHRGRYAEAESGYDELLATAEKLYGLTPRYARHLFGLAHIRIDQGRYRDALEVYRQAQGIYEAATDDPRAGAISSMILGGRAHLHLRLDQPDAAARLLARVDESKLSPGFLIWHRNYVGLLHTYRGEYEQAEAAFKSALSTETHGHGDHHTSVSTLCFLGILQRKQGKLEEAAATLAHVREMVGRRDVDMLSKVSYEQGLVLRDQGRGEEAVEMLRGALEARRRLGQRDHPDTRENATVLTELLYDLGRAGEAAAVERQMAKLKEVSP